MKYLITARRGSAFVFEGELENAHHSLNVGDPFIGNVKGMRTPVAGYIEDIEFDEDEINIPPSILAENHEHVKSTRIYIQLKD